MRLIPQGTVDNNLGPDHLAGQKALDPNYADNQHCDCTTFVWKFSFWGQGIPPTLTINVVHLT